MNKATPTTADFLDQLKAHFGVTSDAELGKRVGWKPQHVSRYRNRQTTFNESTAFTVAAHLQIDPAYVFACMQAQLPKQPEITQVWERVAKQLAKAAALAVFMISGGGGPTPPSASAAQSSAAAEASVCYVKRRGGRKTTRRRATWHDTLAHFSGALAHTFRPA